MFNQYEWPHITYISDVLPYIEDAPEITVRQRDGGITVIDYAFIQDSTFPPVQSDDDKKAIIRRECRGLIFHTDTGILARRGYHKFFNVQERAETHPDHFIEDPLRPETKHMVLEKLDGSMVTPFVMPEGGIIRWATRGGITDVSMQAESFAVEHPEYKYLARYLLFDGCEPITPIFEWCSRQQRIVMDYPDDRLVLTGARYLWSGRYLPYGEMYRVAKSFGVPVVKPWKVNSRFSGSNDISKIIAHIREDTGYEGVVIRFNRSGHMAKLKTAWYVGIHRARDMVAREHDAIKAILTGGYDDLRPLLISDDQERLDKLADAVQADMRAFVSKVIEILKEAAEKGTTRKDFAISTREMESMIRHTCFAVWGEPIDSALRAKVYEHTSKSVIAYIPRRDQHAAVKQVLVTSWKDRFNAPLLLDDGRTACVG